MNKLPICKVHQLCGGCQYQGVDYQQQLELKQRKVENLLKPFGRVEKIIGMKNPYYYRNKVQISFGKDYRGNVIAGNYVTSTHTIVPVKNCQIANEEANKIFNTFIRLVKSFKLSVFDERSLRGFIRHVLVRTSNDNEEIMVVIVTGTEVFPKKRDFINALLKEHPNIVTIVQSVNNRHTSMVLGNKNIVLYGKGYIDDELCGLTFRLSATAFYQVNHQQTEVLYNEAKRLANPQGNEVVIDAYCGIGTIGMTLASSVKEVLGVEINAKAIRDARSNAKLNNVNNISFVAEDAGKYMQQLAYEKKKIDIVIMDPPRSGADNKFLYALTKLSPQKVVYISCNPVTLADNLRYLTKHSYKVEHIQPVDMFPFTEHVETVVLLGNQKSERT